MIEVDDSNVTQPKIRIEGKEIEVILPTELLKLRTERDIDDI